MAKLLTTGTIALAVAVAVLLLDNGGSEVVKTVTQTQHVSPAPGTPLPSVGIREAGAARGLCGVERWAVKVLSDQAAGDVKPQVKDTTIAALTAIPAPRNPTDRVPGVETTMYRLVNVHLSGFKIEGDSDIHLVIDDRVGHTMIAEIPLPTCMKGTAPSIVAAVDATRQHFEQAHGPATSSFTHADATISLQGVGFFDRIHGQTGVAPNGVELHPVIADP